MYNLCAYGRMIADTVRTDTYARALRHVVKPNSVVLDIGTGTGIFALLACQLGARKVYAIELADAIQVAQQIASANGYSDRIEFIQDRSTRVTLTERANVIISDLRGVLPWFQRHMLYIIDARQRLLTPGGILIPQCDTLWAAVVQAPELYSDYTNPWEHNPYGLDMRAAQAIVTNTWSKRRVQPEQLLLEPQYLAKLDYATVESPNLDATVIWTAARSGTGHGFIVWFDSMLIKGVSFSNAPSESELIYGTAFFPWSTPVSLAVGDTVSVTIQAHLVGEDYVWCWESLVLNQGRRDQIKANFKQSTFFGASLAPGRLHKRASHHVPALNEEGQIKRFILSLMDGENSLEQVAKQAAAKFPKRFANSQDSLAYVAELSEQYSR